MLRSVGVLVAASLSCACATGEAANQANAESDPTPTTEAVMDAAVPTSGAAASASNPTPPSITTTPSAGSEPIVVPDWGPCDAETDLAAGFADDTVRIGVRSSYEDWSVGNEVFTAYLEHVGTAGRRSIEVVEIGEAESVPNDLALLADFAAIQVPLDRAEAPPPCLPTLVRSYWQRVADSSVSHATELPPVELLMPALTAESEGALWAHHLQQTIPDLQKIAALVIDVDSGEALLAAFVDALADDVEVAAIRHRPTSHRVTAEVDELLDAAPDALVLMTFGEPCRSATLAAAAREDGRPAAMLMPSSCAALVGELDADWALDGWLALRQPALDRGRLHPDLVAALDGVGWSDFPTETASVLAAWWLIEALEEEPTDRAELVEALLTVQEGPPWLTSSGRFATRGLDDTLAIEGAPLLQHRGGRWELLGTLDLDPGDS